MKEQLLNDLARKVASSADSRSLLFTDWRELLGFRIGWAEPELAAELCGRYGLDPDDCEIIMMQATGLTECHMHRQGSTTFMALGAQHGFKSPAGGTLFGEFQEGRDRFHLVPERAEAGKVFEVNASQIHAFFADQGGELTAIGVVSPKIKNGDQFDVVPFEFVGDHEVRQAA